MIAYEYRCLECKTPYSARAQMADRASSKCPSCGSLSPQRAFFTPTSIIDTDLKPQTTPNKTARMSAAYSGGMKLSNLSTAHCPTGIHVENCDIEIDSYSSLNDGTPIEAVNAKIKIDKVNIKKDPP